MGRGRGVNTEEFSGIDREISSQAGDNGIDEVRNILTAPPPDIMVASSVTKEYAESLSFMEEFVEIRVNESPDPNAENPVQVGCNGQQEMFWRGVTKRVKRKFVNSLIAKIDTITTPEYTNAVGERNTDIVKKSAQKYPFEMWDNNPKGRAWLDAAWRQC